MQMVHNLFVQPKAFAGAASSLLADHRIFAEPI
jgi:hypothetical protein